MELTDIAPLETWLELEQRINERSGLNASVFNVDGLRITDFVKWANSLCPEIKGTEKGQSYICSVDIKTLPPRPPRPVNPLSKPVMPVC